MHLTANEQNVTWADSGDQYIDDDAAQTIWKRIYISDAALDDHVVIFEGWDSWDNYIFITVRTDLEIRPFYVADGVGDSIEGTAETSGQWRDIAYSWDKPNDDHSVYSGGGWTDSNNTITDDMTSDLDHIIMGEEYTSAGDPGVGKYINITQWAIVSGYKTAKPW